MDKAIGKQSGQCSQRFVLSLATLVLCGQFALATQYGTDLQLQSFELSYAQEAGDVMPAEESADVAPTYSSSKGTFAVSDQPFHSDPEILWPGFLSGLRGFEHFYEPVGNPLYFESPFNNTSFRFLYIWHGFPKDSQIGGGDLSAFALQIRLALTERLGFIATKDGYTIFNAGILPTDDGWNDFAIGLKYVFIADQENDFVLTGGFRWEWANGDKEILQGDAQEISPFVSVAKGWDRLHFLGNITSRIPTDGNDGSQILQWDLHLDYEIAPEMLPGFAPLVEIHGLHYLSNGERLPLSVGGFDYTNTGSTDVSGDAVISAGLGFRWKMTPNFSFGSTWEFPLHDSSNDILDSRVVVDAIISW